MQSLSKINSIKLKTPNSERASDPAEFYSAKERASRTPNSKTWRLIPPIEVSGEIQMAIDSWLLEKHRQGEHPPTLRFYTWNPSAISLGYHQKESPKHWQKYDLDIVRRPTGGNAVLHQGDLTYAVVTSSKKGKRLEVYQQICQFLIEGWRSLGVELHYGNATKEYINNPNCFATATHADLITAIGEKAIGSAQLRRGRFILQHGSMMLSTRKDLFTEIFAADAPSNLLDLITAPEDRRLATIVTALTQAARNCFQVELAEQPLSKIEWQDIVTNSVLLTY